MKDEKIPENLENIFERLDDDCNALRPFFIREITADLERRGVNTSSTNDAIQKLLKQAKTAKSLAPAEWLLDPLKEFGARADRFCQGFVSRVFELIQVPDSGFVRTAPVLSNASGETLPTKTVRLDDFVPDAMLKEHLSWAGDFLRIAATKLEPTTTDNAFRVAVDLREENHGAKGELAIGIKFKSKGEFIILSRNQTSTALKYHGPEQLSELSIQVFASISV